MKIRLQVRLDDDHMPEGEALATALPPEEQALLHQRPEVAGSVWLEAAGQPGIELQDDLGQLVPQLCVQAIADLARGQEVRVSLFVVDDAVTLTPQGAQLQVRTDSGAAATYPLADTLDALQSCARLYLAFLQANLAQEPAGQRQVAELRMRMRAAGQTLPPPGRPVAPEPVQELIPEDELDFPPDSPAS